MSTTQLSLLAMEWPRTFQALSSTYYAAAAWGVTRANGENDAGYLIQGLARFERAAMDLHRHKGINRHTLDVAAAREVLYQAARKAQFRRPCAALSACFASLVIERPERLYAARAREERRASQAAH